jgi:hypothetical protein
LNLLLPLSFLPGSIGGAKALIALTSGGSINFSNLR